MEFLCHPGCSVNAGPNKILGCNEIEPHAPLDLCLFVMALCHCRHISIIVLWSPKQESGQNESKSEKIFHEKQRTTCFCLSFLCVFG